MCHPDLWRIKPNHKRIAALSLLCASVVFASAITEFDSLFIVYPDSYSSSSSTVIHYGIWRWTETNNEGDGTPYSSYSRPACTFFEDGGDCGEQQMHKCRTIIAFSIIAELAIAVAIAMALMPVCCVVNMPSRRNVCNLLCSIAALFSSFSYLVILSITAFNFNQDGPGYYGYNGGGDGDCGWNNAPWTRSGSSSYGSNTLFYGPSFYLVILNMLVLFVVAVVMMVSFCTTNYHAESSDEPLLREARKEAAARNDGIEPMEKYFGLRSFLVGLGGVMCPFCCPCIWCILPHFPLDKREPEGTENAGFMMADLPPAPQRGGGPDTVYATNLSLANPGGNNGFGFMDNPTVQAAVDAAAAKAVRQAMGGPQNRKLPPAPGHGNYNV